MEGELRLVKSMRQQGGKLSAEQLINPIVRGWVNYFAIGPPVDALALSKTGWRRRCGDI
jgi:Group II intron, maturase-specific domain